MTTYGPVAVRRRPDSTRAGWEWIAPWAAYAPTGRMIVARRTRAEVVAALAA